MITKRALLLVGLVTVAGGMASACKKQEPQPAPAPAAPAAQAPKPPAEPPLPEIHCPPESTFASLGGKGRVLHTACTVFAPGRYWLATALSYDEKAGKAGRGPKLSFLSGSPAGKIMLFDVQPLPAPAIDALIKDSKQVGVQIRKTRDDRSLVRLGVTGSSGDPAKPDLREVGLLLQLVAHKPPHILWTGPGDQITTEGGCITEQRIEFEMLFRTRLERFSVTRTRPAPGGKPEACAAGPSMQETVGFQGVPLARGRALGEDAPRK